MLNDACRILAEAAQTIQGCLALTLLEPGIFLVDHVKLSFAAHNLAICTALFYCCSNLHDSLLAIVS